MSTPAEPEPMDPSGVLMRSADPGTGFIPIQPPPVTDPLRSRRGAEGRRAARGPAPRSAWSLAPWSRARWSRVWPAAAALLGAMVLIGLDAAAIGAAGRGEFVAATVLAWAGIALSAAVVVAAALCMVLGRGRWIAAIAAVLGLVANPYLLTRILELFQG